jgi:hypothetical protein
MNKDNILRTALFWDIMQRRVVILYRRFGTTCRSSKVKKTKKRGFLLGLCESRDHSVKMRGRGFCDQLNEKLSMLLE